MLRAILMMAASGGPLSTAALAERLGASVPELEDMIGRLVALGYLERVGAGMASCGGPARCGGCPSRAACHAAEPIVLWALTGKGKAAAALPH